MRRPWAGSRVDVTRSDPNASRLDLSGGDLGSGSSGVDLGSGSRTELGEFGFLPPLGGTSISDSRRPSLPISAGVLFGGSKTHRPRSDRTSWSGGKVRKFFSRVRRGDSTSWDAGEPTGTIDWAEEVEFRRGERVAVEMGLKAPSAALLARRNPGHQNDTVRPRRKASEFHPEPEYEFIDEDPLENRPVIQDDDGDFDDDRDMDLVPPKRVLHPRSFSQSSGTGFSRSGMGRLTSPSMPCLTLPHGPSLVSSAATSTTSIPAATSPLPTPVRSHAPSPAPQAHARSTSGSSTTRRGLRGSSSLSSFLPRQPEEVMPSSGESTLDGTAPVTVDPGFQPQLQGHIEVQQQQPIDPESSLLLQPPDGRFRGDSLSSDSTSSENTNQLSSSMATTDTGVTTPSLYGATSPLPHHKGIKAISPVFEADDLDEEDEDQDRRRRSITPLNLRTVNTFEQAQSLVRQVEREILDPGPLGPDSPSLVEQLAAYGESLAIERRFARGEAQRRAWQAERKSLEEEAQDEEEDEEGGWATYVRDYPGPRIGMPLGKAASVDYHMYKTVRSPSRTHSMPVRQNCEWQYFMSLGWWLTRF